MRYSDVFGSCHPAVNFLYFVLVIAFSMCLTHPVCLLLSVCGAVIYHAVLLGPRSLRKSAVWMVPMAVLAAVINPAFTHQGVTILAYLPSGNPLTLESMLYGLASAALLSATLLWFTCYNAVMTSDKFIYLFGRVIPALSLVLSMTMRFVPRFRTQLHTVAQAQKYMGRDTENGSLLRRTKNAMKVFSIMVTWSLESAIETADSMKSRGYGEKGRTAFSIYRMDDRDRSLLVWLIFCGAYVLCGVLAGGLRFRYYPSLAGAPVTPMTVSFFVVYFLLCLTPAALDLAAAASGDKSRRRCAGDGASASGELQLYLPPAAPPGAVPCHPHCAGGCVHGTLRPIRLRKIHAAAAAENGTGASWPAGGGDHLLRHAAGTDPQPPSGGGDRLRAAVTGESGGDGQGLA